MLEGQKKAHSDVEYVDPIIQEARWIRSASVECSGQNTAIGNGASRFLSCVEF